MPASADFESSAPGRRILRRRLREREGCSMKARFILLALLAAALLLAACGTDRAEPPAVPEETPAPAELRLPPALTREESQAMTMVLNANRVLLADDELFCYDFDENWQPVLARYHWEDGKLSDFTVLAKGCVPEYLCATEQRLFYIDRRSGALERVREWGGRREVLNAGPCSWLCMRDGMLYFCDAEGRYLSMNPKNKEETELLPGPCAFAYPLEGAILWQDRDERGIFLTDTESRVTRQLSRGPTGAPLLLGDRLWFYSGGAVHNLGLDGSDPKVYRLPRTEGAVELLPERGGLLLRGIRETDGPVQWYGRPGGPFRTLDRGYLICEWLTDELRVETVYEPDGRILRYRLRDGEGLELSFLAGKVTGNAPEEPEEPDDAENAEDTEDAEGAEGAESNASDPEQEETGGAA